MHGLMTLDLIIHGFCLLRVFRCCLIGDFTLNISYIVFQMYRWFPDVERLPNKSLKRGFTDGSTVICLRRLLKNTEGKSEFGIFEANLRVNSWCVQVCARISGDSWGSGEPIGNGTRRVRVGRRQRWRLDRRCWKKNYNLWVRYKRVNCFNRCVVNNRYVWLIDLYISRD